jgi:cytochrome-b5 reductase
MKPSKPERPLESDCCGQGCSNCVFDVFERELALWQRECDEKDGHQAQPCMNQDKYELCEVEAVTTVAPDTNLYRFRLCRGVQLHASPGQHLVARNVNTEDNTFITRQYTLLPDKSLSHFEVLVKLYPEGRMSTAICSSWRVGSHVEWRGPVGHVDYVANTYDHVVMLGVGTGTLPLTQVAKHICSDEEDEARLHLFLGFRSLDHILLEKELRNLAAFWNCSLHLFLSQEKSEGSRRPFAKVIHSRMTEEAVNFEMSAFQGSRTLYLVCGTRSFEASVLLWLSAQQEPKSQIRKCDHYTASLRRRNMWPWPSTPTPTSPGTRPKQTLSGRVKNLRTVEERQYWVNKPKDEDGQYSINMLNEIRILHRLIVISIM